MLNFIAACVLSLTAFAVSTFSQYYPDVDGNSRRITVTGDAEVRVEPARVVLTFGVETINPILSEATSTNDVKSRAILAFMREAGIAAKDVQTDFISVRPVYEGWDDNRQTGKFLHHIVRKSVVVLLRDVSKFETVLSGALERGASHILAVRFESDRLKQHRDTARVNAVRAAREKAALLAAELGAKLGKVITIRELQIYEPSMYWGSSWEYRARGGGSSQVSIQGDAPAMSPTSGDSLALGQMRVNAQVNVVFELQ